MRSISKTECEKMPSLYLASGGGILALITVFSLVLFIKYQKRKKCKDDVKDFEEGEVMFTMTVDEDDIESASRI